MRERPTTFLRDPRSGFTVVEAIVALAMMGVAGALLAATFTVTIVARRTAALDSRGAEAVRARIAFLSRRPCTAPDTSAVDEFGAVRVAWSARRIRAGWEFSDSIALPGVASRRPFTGRVRCP